MRKFMCVVLGCMVIVFAGFAANADTCGAGFYTDGASCIKCPAAYPNSVPGATSIMHCYSNARPNPGICNVLTGCASIKCPECNSDDCRYYTYVGGIDFITGDLIDGNMKMACDSNDCYNTEIVAAAGYYTDGVQCHTCPNSMASVAGATDVSWCVDQCPVGTYRKGTACIKCTGGTYNDTIGATACTKCPDGTASFAGATDITQCVEQCPAGTYKSGSTCKQCPADYPNSNIGTTDIKQCYSNPRPNAPSSVVIPNGCSATTHPECTGDDCTYVVYAQEPYFWEPDIVTDGVLKSVCQNGECRSPTVVANAGYYAADGVCPACPDGMVSEAGATECTTECPRIDQYIGLDSFLGITTCVSCPSNNPLLIAGTSQCVSRCPEDYIRDDMYDVCIPCPDGTVNTAGAFNACIEPCAENTYLYNGACNACPADYPYATAHSRYACSCYSAPRALTSTDKCPTFTNCSTTTCKRSDNYTYVVYYGDAFVAGCDGPYIKEVCIDGTCSPVIGMRDGYYFDGTSCQQCPANTFSMPNATDVSQCLSACPAGMYGDANTNSCKTCPAGTYSATGATECSKCPAGTTSFAGASQCMEKCPAGMYKNGAMCAECPADYPNSDVGATSIKQCYSNPRTDSGNCRDGCACECVGDDCKYVVWYGGDLPWDPTIVKSICHGDVCDDITAKAGYYFDGIACPACAAGTYSEAGATECTSCPDGTVATADKTACVTKCPENTYLKDGTCTACPAEFPNSDAGATAITQCYSNPRSESGQCPNAPDGCASISCECAGDDCTYVVYYGKEPELPWDPPAGGALKSICENGTCHAPTVVAKAGDYTDGKKCIECPPGTTSDGGNITECTLCPAGTYQNGNVCMQCNAGTYSQPGATACTPCPAGTVSTTDKTTCVEQCPAGTYSVDNACNTCPADYPNSEPGSVGILSCYSNPRSESGVCSTGNSSCPLTCPECTGDGCEYVVYYGYAWSGANRTKSVCKNGVCTDTTATASDGYYVNDILRCAQCPSGTYTAPDKRECVKTCPTGTYNNGKACLTCPDGQFVSGGGDKCVTQCAGGFYADGAVCTKCPDGTASFAGATDISQCVEQCPTGTYRTIFGECVQCPDGYPYSEPGAESITECYSDEKWRPYTGNKICPSPATGCSGATCDFSHCNTEPCRYVAGAKLSELPWDPVEEYVKEGCETNNTDCIGIIKSVSVPAGYGVTATGACEICKSGTYGPGGDNAKCLACPDGLSSRPGSDDAGDCGRILNMKKPDGDAIQIYLNSIKKTAPALAVRINGQNRILYGHMRPVSDTTPPGVRIDVNGTRYTLYNDMASPVFSVTTTSGTSEFEFTMSASGRFVVHWGDGEFDEIVRDNTTAEKYSHKYSSPGQYTVGFAGVATGYNTSNTVSAISFANNANVAGISGRLGGVFPYAGGRNPLFYGVFENCTNLGGEIPAELFVGIKWITPTNQGAFEKMFSGCAKLTGPSARTPDGTPFYKYSTDGTDWATLYIEAEFPWVPSFSPFQGMYTGCVGLSDYDAIPDMWK